MWFFPCLSLTPLSYRQYLKKCEVKKLFLQYFTSGRNFNGLWVIAKSCSNVNISDSAVPTGFPARVKIPMISVDLPFHDIFFMGSCSLTIVQIMLCLIRKKMQSWKTKWLLQCSLLASLKPINAMLLMLYSLQFLFLSKIKTTIVLNGAAFPRDFFLMNL